MSWLVFTFLSIISRSIYGMMSKVLSSKLKISVYTQAFLLLGIGGLVSILISPLLGGISFDFSDVSLAAVLLVIIGQGFGNILYFEAIKSLTSSTAQITFSSILVFNTLLALVFLNLHLNFINVFGILLLLIAITSVTTGKIKLNRRGVVLMLFAALLFSVFQLASAEISKQVSAATYLLIAYFGSATLIFALKAKQVTQDILHVKNPKYIIGVVVATAVPSVGNFLFAYYAYRDAPEPAKVAMLLTSQVVLTVILSYFLLKERDHLSRKISAAILVLVSAIMIKD